MTTRMGVRLLAIGCGMWSLFSPRGNTWFIIAIVLFCTAIILEEMSPAAPDAGQVGARHRASTSK